MNTVYAGLDFGWKSFRYEFRTKTNKVIERGGADSTPEGLKKVLEKYKKYAKVKVAFEAGAQLYWVDRVIKDLGFSSHPFHAANFNRNKTSKIKTDKKDAEEFVKSAVLNDLPKRIYIPTQEEQDLRNKLGERESLKKNLTACGNRLHALSIEVGLQLQKKSLSRSLKHWEEAVPLFKDTCRYGEAERLYKLALVIFQNMDAVEEEIKAITTQGEMGEARKRLETIPGIGFWVATALLAWCGPRASRFPKSRHASSYFGLTRSTYESSTILRHGHITKSGPSLVRKLLAQAAWAFLRARDGRNSEWGYWYHKMTSRDKDRRKKSTIALARRILTAAVACLQNESEWDPAILEKKKQNAKKQALQTKIPVSTMNPC
jgi:transposase